MLREPWGWGWDGKSHAACSRPQRIFLLELTGLFASMSLAGGLVFPDPVFSSRLLGRSGLS